MSEWKTRCADGDEKIVGSVEMLRQWASEGKIIKTDYVWNPILQQWCYAADVIELYGVVGSVRGVSSTRHGCGISAFLVIFGLIAMTFNPLVGGFVAFIGVVMALVLALAIVRSRFAKS